MQGKVCLVTGATSGIGAATAQALAARGATVVLVGRNRDKCTATADQIRRSAPAGSVDTLVADLSLQSQVHRASDEFHQRYSRLDVLVNNAAAIHMRRSETAEGLESTFALNHLAYFLLTNLVLDRLRSSAEARVINVASSGHFLADGINFDDLQGRTSYRGFKAYHQSKLAAVLFTYELSRRESGAGVTVNAVDPGMVSTNIGTNNGWMWKVSKPIFDTIRGVKYISPEEGARTLVYLACSPDVAGVTGKYFVREQAVPSSPASYDANTGRKLWEVCEDLTRAAAGTDTRNRLPAG